eukprot:6202625-Pleurochrysis_carterae.AAC.4
MKWTHSLLMAEGDSIWDIKGWIWDVQWIASHELTERRGCPIVSIFVSYVAICISTMASWGT